MRGRGTGTHWGRTLNERQLATVKRIRHRHNGRPATDGGHAASHGWRVYMMPTTMPARYLELRHYMTDGKVSVWVIESDGWVSERRVRGER